MSRRDDRVSLSQMLDHAVEAVSYGAGKTAEDIAADRLLQLALVRLLEVLGEAAGRVTPPTRERYPELPWRSTVNLRNRLIHGYDTISWDVVAGVINDELPPLISRLEQILATDFPAPPAPPAA